MIAARLITCLVACLMLRCAAWADISFVTSAGAGDGNYNNTTAKLGFIFTNTSGEPIVITQLARRMLTGNSQSHTVAIYSNATPPVQLASATVNMAGQTVGSWVTRTLTTPYTMAAGQRCYIVSSEVSGGDAWQGNGGTNLIFTDVSSGSNLQSAYIDAGGTGFPGNDDTRSYGPVNFYYSSPVPGWSKVGTVYTTNGTQYSANSALGDSSPGDTITIPAGTYTWGSGGLQTYVTKAVTLTGSIGGTTLNIAGTAPQYANGTINLGASGAIVRDLTLTQSGGSYSSAINGYVSGWRVTGITYNSAAAAGYFVYAGSYGLIDHCTINGGGGSDEWIFTRGPTDAWQTASSMGTANAVYVEDCIFNSVGYTDFNANSRGVVRFCTINPGASATIKLDAHGKVTNTPARSFRHIEFYNNTWSVVSNPNVEMRGGTGMIFNNTSVGGGALYLGDYYVVYGTYTAADYPIDDQIGVGMDPKSAASEPVYLWGNTGVAGANNPASPSLYGVSMAGVINADRDYFDTAAGFDGSSGVGRGTKAAMNAINMSGKTLRVGYWVTDEASWNTNLTAGTSGQLYTWNGSAWVLKYTPYTYPHPLNSGGGGGTPITPTAGNAPAAPVITVF